jgi:MFS family permease|tara:strand:- start:2223 stop:3431 length:1209 start_codon:yes stop_codon:yes gene_type:complete
LILYNINFHRGWAIAAACFLASSVAVGGSQYSFGHFVEPLENTFGWTRTQIGLSLSLIAFGSFISPLIGSLIDKQGSRRIMAFSMAVFGISYLVRPFMTELWHWYFLSVVQSFSIVGAAMLPPGKLVGLWFPENRGRVIGITAMGNNFGGMVIQPIIAFLVTVYNWKVAYAVVGALGILVSIYAYLVVKNPDSESEGILESEKNTANLTGFTLKEAVRTKTFYAITFAILCGTFTYSSLLPQVSSHLIINGVRESTASIAVSLFATCGMVGKFVFGNLSDKYGPRMALVLDLCGQAIFASLLVYAGDGLPVWVIVPAMGFFLGAFGALYQLIVIDAFGVKHFGAIMGVIAISNAVPSFLGPIIAGMSFDITGSYAVAFVITSVIFVLGAISLKLTRENSTLG